MATRQALWKAHDPQKNLPISGGGNSYNYANLVDNDLMVLSKQNTTGTVYNYYRNQPEALVDMFDDTRYPALSNGNIPRLSDLTMAHSALLTKPTKPQQLPNRLEPQHFPLNIYQVQMETTQAIPKA